jgi:thiopurine S-methyltransferase
VPTRRKAGKFTRWEHGRISLLCGDYFSLAASDLGEIDAVYDRAALTALPEDLRGLMSPTCAGSWRSPVSCSR